MIVFINKIPQYLLIRRASIVLCLEGSLFVQTTLKKDLSITLIRWLGSAQNIGWGIFAGRFHLLWFTSCRRSDLIAESSSLTNSFMYIRPLYFQVLLQSILVPQLLSWIHLNLYDSPSKNVASRIFLRLALLHLVYFLDFTAEETTFSLNKRIINHDQTMDYIVSR